MQNLNDGLNAFENLSMRKKNLREVIYTTLLFALD